jgi:hypothetical protein
LKRVDAAGGGLLTICDAERGVGGTWNRDGVIVFGPAPTSPLYRVPAGGGRPVAVTKLDAARHETAHRYPTFLPDGRRFLYTAANISGAPNDPANAIRLGSLDGKEDRVVAPYLANPQFASGHLLYGREGTLLAQRLDARLQPVGDPVPIAQRVLKIGWVGLTWFTVSNNGLLAYAPSGTVPSQLLWFDRGGKPLGSVGEPANYFGTRVSPDGRRVAVDAFDTSKSTVEISIYNSDGSGANKFAFGPGNRYGPVWSPDGTKIAFASDRKAVGVRPDVVVKALEGGAETTLLESADSNIPESWSPDGRFLSLQVIPAKGKRNNEVWVLDVAARKTIPVSTSGNFAGDSRFSPDGHWLAYDSDESGRSEVYVQSFPGPGGTWQVSPAGGSFPHWRGDGKEIFYVSLDNKIMSVPVEAGAGFHAGAPVPLFSVHPASGGPTGSIYDVSSDGKRFLVNSLPADQGSPPLSLLVHWTGLLAQ